MEQCISKSALVAEIEKRIKKYAKIDVGNSSELDALYGAKCHALKSILTFINTLEEKEVDFEREFDNYIEDQNAFINNDNSEIKYYNGDSFNHTYDIYPLAKHFFELGLQTYIPVIYKPTETDVYKLGLKAQKGE